MRDAIEARLWADHGHEFADALARLFTSVGTAFRRLNAIQYDAPWTRDDVRRRPGQA